MKSLKHCALGIVGVLLLSNVHAQIAYQGTWVQGTITEIQVLGAGGSGLNEVLVFGNFTPNPGCTVNAFEMVSTDSYFSQEYAALLAAQAKGVQAKFLFVYCIANGPARGNGYSVLSN